MGKSHPNEPPILKRYGVSLNNILVATLVNGDGRSEVQDINYFHPMFMDEESNLFKYLATDRAHRIEDLLKLFADELENSTFDDSSCEISDFDELPASMQSSLREFFQASGADTASSLSDDESALVEDVLTSARAISSRRASTESTFQISSQLRALPALEQLIEFDYGLVDFDSEDVGLSYLETCYRLSAALLGPAQLVRDNLRAIRHIGPFRDLPPRNFLPAKNPSADRWANGMGAWDVLTQDKQVLQHTNRWLDNAGYTLDYELSKSLPVHSPLAIALANDSVEDLPDTRDEFHALGEEPKLCLQDNRSLLPLALHDVGVGLSQVIPVMVAACDRTPALVDQVVSIEQPELHIHPKLQVVLGDLFAWSIKRGSRMFLLETHSEHLMLRLLRRIEETSSGELPVDGESLKAEDLSVHYIRSGQEGMEVTLLPVDEEGEFKVPWPDGFFDERSKEFS